MSNEKETVTVMETEVEQATEVKSLDEAKAELAKARDALRAANAEAAERRRKLKSFEDADALRQAEDQKRRDAELSEVERLKKEISDTKARETAALQKAEERLLRSSVLAEATKLGFVDAEDAWTFADKSKLSVEGETVRGAHDAAEAVLKAKPHLKAGALVKPPNTNAVNQHSAQDAEARAEELSKRFRIPIRR